MIESPERGGHLLDHRKCDLQIPSLRYCFSSSFMPLSGTCSSCICLNVHSVIVTPFSFFTLRKPPPKTTSGPTALYVPASLERSFRSYTIPDTRFMPASGDSSPLTEHSCGLP